MSIIKNPLEVSNYLAQDTKGAGVFDELDEDLIRLISEDRIKPKPLLICSGGTSSQCADNNKWTLDLRSKYQEINIDSSSQEVEIGGGVKMVNLINKLYKSNQSFPIGLSNQTGVGYILTGGISPLSRTYGLAVDQILELQGVWGTGESFEIKKPKEDAIIEEKLKWRALCGASIFLAIITKIKLKTQLIKPIYLLELIASPKQLSECISLSENWPNNISLQWAWRNRINISIVIEINSEFTNKNFGDLINYLPCNEPPEISKVEGISHLPNFKLKDQLNQSNKKVHSEVISLLGKEWGNNSWEAIKTIKSLMKVRPHENCYIAAQQLGGATSNKKRIESSFIHRGAMWKPWINGAWTAGDIKTKKESLNWMEKCWENIEFVCPGVHLAQIHQHLNWHPKELQRAFEDWLPELQNLKSIYDPQGLLPPL
tara:strand:- start:5169 stop:6455 length:1287 start_codon:yes stop_codon:yes gene_type:complete